MKKFSVLCNLLLIALLGSALAAQADSYTMPKREFRSAWVATVWALDWPRDVNGSELCSMNGEAQKAAMTRLLDSLKNNNFNAVNFQVRSMCDAMYKSSYEPWSSYLTGTRGQAPNYDPLQFVVEECHKRGMECHAWINPYRFSTGSDWNTEQDKQLKASGHLLSYGKNVILNPAHQWTIDRIVNVCKEVITNYDVDGILYDDYFYPNGIPSNETAGDYQEWKDAKTGMSLGDWRRANVNRMVKAVYDMIQDTKPYVRFGISPAGVAATSKSVADKYGVDPCPSGTGDWQYNGIFSDPLAWISSQTIDYISPQVYWKIGATANYATITPWWNKVAAKFNRHAYISSSISSITKNSNATAYAEYANQTQLNRTSSVDGNPGAIYYSCKYLYAMAPKSLAAHLKATVFTQPALPPAMSWKQGNAPGKVTHIEKSGNLLSWKGFEGVRYSIYAFPCNADAGIAINQSQYLMGMSYSPRFELPAKVAGEGWLYAVCVVDRVGNEYAPAFSENLPQLPSPSLVAPEDNFSSAKKNFNFSWNKVDGATRYIVELSNNADMSNMIERVTTTQTMLPATQLSKLGNSEKQYWRVLASASGYSSGVSTTRQINMPRVASTFVTPTHGGVLKRGSHVEIKPQSWANTQLIEISSSSTVWGRTRFMQTLKNGATQTTLPAEEIKVDGKLMQDGKTYYARTKSTYLIDGINKSTAFGDIISFTYSAGETIKGDITGDGKIDMNDASALINMILGTSPANLAKGDLNGDGVLNVTDVTTLINSMLNK